MDEIQSLEKRRHTRFLVTENTPLEVEIVGLSLSSSLEAVNISEGGIGVRFSEGTSYCDINQPVSFALKVPGIDGDLLRGYGRVKHRNQGYLGVEFGRLSVDATDNLRGFIASCIKEDSWISWLKYKMRLVA